MKCIDTGNIYLYQASTKKKTENKNFSFPIKLNMKKETSINHSKLNQISSNQHLGIHKTNEWKNI